MAVFLCGDAPFLLWEGDGGQEVLSIEAKSAQNGGGPLLPLCRVEKSARHSWAFFHRHTLATCVILNKILVFYGWVTN